MLFSNRYCHCFADGTIIIEPANALTITSATPTNVSCNNDNSTITILAAGGTPNYTYAAVLAGATAQLLMQHLIWLWSIPIRQIYHGMYM
jgi:hypothetical protein